MMKARIALEWAGTILFGVAGAAIGIWLMRSPTALALGPPVERPATVDAFVARLKTSELLAGMNANPSSCSRVPKPPTRDRCYYRAGEMEILVAWYKGSGRLAGLSIQKIETPGSAPFAWRGLAEMVSLLCGGLGADQANAVVHDVRERLLQAAWYRNNGDRVTADADGASRRVSIKPSDACGLEFDEITTGRSVRRFLRASPVYQH